MGGRVSKLYRVGRNINGIRNRWYYYILHPFFSKLVSHISVILGKCYFLDYSKC